MAAPSFPANASPSSERTSTICPKRAFWQDWRQRRWSSSSKMTTFKRMSWMFSVPHSDGRKTLQGKRNLISSKRERRNHPMIWLEMLLVWSTSLEIFLTEISAPLLPYIRLEYILPANCPDLAKVFQSGLIRNPPTSIDGSTTIGRGWDYGDSRSPRFYKPFVEIFLELNSNEWSEGTLLSVNSVTESLL